MTWVFDPVIHLNVEPTVEHYQLLVSSDSEDMSMTMDTAIVVGGGMPYYTGEYEVVPTFEEQTLATADKTMANDVTVHAIEVSRTSNPAGGKTVYIGGTING